MYKLVIEFSDFRDLREKLRELLRELEALSLSEAPSEKGSEREVVVLFDETVRDVGVIASRISEDLGMRVRVYEVSSSISEVVQTENVVKVPAKGDIDVLRWAKKLGAVLVTGDRKLARTAEAYGVKVVYLPPSGVISKEHYVIEALKRVKERMERSSKA